MKNIYYKLINSVGIYVLKYYPIIIFFMNCICHGYTSQPPPICYVKGGGGRVLFMFLYLFTYTGVQHYFHVRWYSRCLTVTRRVSLMEQELQSTSGTWVHPRFLVDHCLSFCTLSFGHCVVCPSSFGHCVVCPSSIYRFLLPLWFLQTLFTYSNNWIILLFCVYVNLPGLTRSCLSLGVPTLRDSKSAVHRLSHHRFISVPLSYFEAYIDGISLASIHFQYCSVVFI